MSISNDENIHENGYDVNILKQTCTTIDDVNKIATEYMKQHVDEWYKISVNVYIRDGMFHVSIGIIEDRTCVTPVYRYCPSCKRPVEYRDFKQRNENLSKEKLKNRWLDPKSFILCRFCFKQKKECEKNIFKQIFQKELVHRNLRLFYNDDELTGVKIGSKVYTVDGNGKI